MQLVLKDCTLSWTRVVTPEEYEGKKSWSTTATLTQDSVHQVMEIKAEGVKNVLKKNDDNQWYIKWSRPVERKNKAGKVVQTFSPPVVTDASNNIIDGSKIGNDTKADVVLDVYEHNAPGGKKAKAARLEGIRVTNLVEYNG